MKNSRLDEINKLLKDIDNRNKNLTEEKETATKRIKEIDADVKSSEEKKAKLEDAKKKGEEFETSYNAALTDGKSLEKDKKKSKEKDKKKKKKKDTNKNNKVAKAIIALSLAGAIGVSCFAIGRATAKNNNKDNDKDTDLDETKQTIYYLDKETGEYLPYKEGYNVTEFYIMDENGQFVLYDEYVMSQSKDVVISQEEFEELAANFIKMLRDKGISESDLTNEDIMKFVAIVNIENLDPELIQVLRGNEDASQFITEGMTVTGHVSAYNRNYYNKNHNTDGFINISAAFPEGTYGYNSMKLLESYRDQCSAVVNCEPLENFTDENGVVHELYEVKDYDTARNAYNVIISEVLYEINEGSLVGINHRGCGLAAVMPLFDITETISRAGAWQRMLINDQNYGEMHAIMTMEGPGSIIVRIFDEPCAAKDIVAEEDKTLSVNNSYTRRRTI